MALNLTIDDCTNARFVLPAAITLFLTGIVTILMKINGFQFEWYITAILAMMGLTAIFLLITGAFNTRSARIRAEADRPNGYQSRRRRRTTGDRH